MYKIVRVKINSTGFVEYHEQETNIPPRDIDLRLDMHGVGIGYGIFEKDFDPKELFLQEYNYLRD